MIRDGRAIIDLRGIVLRCYYGSGAGQTVPSSIPGKKPVPHASHAVHNFITQCLSPILSHVAPIDVIAVLEGKDANARRRSLHPSYKADKEQDADDPACQEQKDIASNAIQQILLSLGAVLVKTPFCEADDTIAYLAKRLKGGKMIYTVDNDMLALYAHDTSVIVSGDFVTEYKGIDLTQHDPRLVTLYKSIVGDTSDKIPGIKGMGKAAWEKLWKLYSAEELSYLCDCVETQNYQPIRDSLAEQPCKYLEKILASTGEWRSSWTLASLHPEWCETTYREKVIRPQWAKRLPDRDRMVKALEPLGLEPLVDQFKRYFPTQTLVDLPVWERMDMDRLARAISKAPFVPFDWESYDALKNPNYQEARKSGEYVDVINQVLTGGSFCFGDNLQHTIYVSVKHRDTRNCPPEVLKDILDEIVNVQRKQTVAHNAKFEMTLAKTNLDFDFPNENLPHDTAIMSSYVNENDEAGLKLLSKKWLNYNQINYSDIVDKSEGQDMRDISGEEVLKYGADDSFVTGHLKILFNIILECEQTYDFYAENEPFFDKALLDSYIKGMPVDYVRLAELEAEDAQLQEETEKELRQLLEEHCSEVNDAGFEALWPEVKDFKAAEMSKKEKSVEYIQEKLGELKLELYDKCRYHPISPPDIHVDKRTLSMVAKLLNMPGIRSPKQAWLENYVNGLYEQMDEGVQPTDDQSLFLNLLMQAAPYVQFGDAGMAQPEVKSLMAFCKRIVTDNKSSWEGDELNVGSPQQMAELFYGKMGLPILVRNFVTNKESTRSLFDLEGAPSTNEVAIRTWMVELKEDDWKYKVLDCILTLRAVRTRYSLYYRPYPLWQSPIDGNIHPGIRNCGTVTRRPTGSNPNIFQASKKDDGKIRTIILPVQDDIEPHVIVSIDFNQQELVITAGESGDDNLRACYVGNNKKDVHSQTGSKILSNLLRRKGQPPVDYSQFIALIDSGDKEATKCRKKYAKTTNFLLVYKGSVAGLARKIIVPKELAQDFYDAFYESYPNVGVMQEDIIKFARKNGFVKTCYGNRKHCDGIFHKDKGIRAAWERQSVNMPIQGGAADVLKKTMRAIVVSRLCEETGARLYAPIYDEIVASVRVSKVAEFIDRLSDIMEIELPGLNISLTTSTSLGRNWGDQIEVGRRPDLHGLIAQHYDGSKESVDKLLTAIDMHYNPKKYEQKEAA